MKFPSILLPFLLSSSSAFAFVTTSERSCTATGRLTRQFHRSTTQPTTCHSTRWTPLHSFFNDDDEGDTETPLGEFDEGNNNESSNGINYRVVLTNLANQALIGSTIWTGGAGAQVLAQQAHWTPLSVVLGIVVGALPLMALSRRIETSDSYLLSGLNLSTNMAVLRLFGSTTRPVAALVVSALLAGVTGVVEEVVFRGQLLESLRTGSQFSTGTAAFLSTLVFAVLHTNPLRLFQGGPAAVDNAILLVLQMINGGMFAALYLGTGGNLAVPIVAHAVYDFYIFYKTHMVDVAGQMDYAAAAQQQANDDNYFVAWNNNRQSAAIRDYWIRQRGPDFVRGVQQSFYLMDTNRDGVLSPTELRIALFSYGINLSPEQTALVTERADVDQNRVIDFDEFLQFVGPSGSTTKAVRNTLFGPI